MITHFIPAPSVKEYSKIALYRDHEDPYTFYYINCDPRVSVDEETKKPAFDYLVIGRNIKREGAEGVQEGRLVMSVNLALTEKEMTAVENTVKNCINEPDFVNKNKPFYPKYDFTKNTTTSLVVNRTRWALKFSLRVKGVNAQVSIRPVEYTSGTALLNLPSTDFAGKDCHEVKPTLFGDCGATFAVNLDSQESQILYELFKPREGSDKRVNLNTSVNYEMKYNSFVPFEAKATIHYERIYKELQNLLKSHSGLDSKYYGCYSLPATGCTYYSNGVDLYVSKEDLQNYLRNSDTTKQNISIDIKDYSIGNENSKYEDLLLAVLQEQLTKDVSSKLFEKTQPLSPQDGEVSHYDVKTTGSKGSESSENAENNSKRNVIFDVCYKLKSDVSTTVTNDFEMTITKGKVIESAANPNHTLELLLENTQPKCNINSLVRELDASDIYYQEMLVPISVDNSNFGRDIAMISVRVNYKGKDGKVKLDKVFNFDEESPDTKTFRVIMDRNSNRELIDKFYYQTRIRYRGFDVYGKNTSEDNKWTKVKEAHGVGEGIYVPYSDMRNLCVNCEAGDIAWDVIEKVAVEFKYKTDPDKTGATKLMTLTAANPSDTWNCFMYNDSDTYVYRIHYFYQDGTDDWSNEFEGNSKMNKLIINDKLSGMFRTKFDINFKKSIERVRVIVKCQGKEEDSGWIYQPDTWTWQTRLKEDKEMTYQYKYQYYLVNGDDSLQSVNWSSPRKMNTESNQQTISINLEINQISLIIDGESIDWNKWSRVYLHFKYNDDAHGLHYDDENIPPLKLSANKNESTVVIPVIDDSIRPTIYAEYIPQNGDDVITSDETEAKKVVILPNAAPPKCDIAPKATTTAAASEAPTQACASDSEETSSPKPVEQDLSLTFNVNSVDWDKWYVLYIHVKYDDEANGIHINDQTLPPIKIKKGGDDKTISFKIKDPTIKPKITVDYMSQMGDVISSAPTPVSGPKVNLPDAVPPEE